MKATHRRKSPGVMVSSCSAFSPRETLGHRNQTLNIQHFIPENGNAHTSPYNRAYHCESTPRAAAADGGHAFQ